MISPTNIEDWKARRDHLLEDLSQRPRGLSWCHDYTELIDEIVATTAGGIDKLLPNASIVAVGGYGRSELAPFSDLDLSLVPVEDQSPWLDQAVRQFFTELYSTFGQLKIEVSYAYRLVSDAPGLDGKTRTGLLDARLVAGSSEVFKDLTDALEETISPGEFILDKIEERQRAWQRYNDSPLVVEPHLKEGAGGLRCSHAANWIRLAIREREKKPTRHYDALLRTRNLLHLISGRQNDLLSRSRQAQIADSLGLPLQEMMSQHCEHALHNHEEFRSSVDKVAEARFRLSGAGVAIRGEARIDPGADCGYAAIAIAVAQKLGLRTPEMATGALTQTNGPAAAYALAQGEICIRAIDRAGLLELLLPELTSCRTLIPNDSIHQFTVFEHTLRMIRILEELPDGHWLSDLLKNLVDREHLVMAVLLHDVGKRIDEGTHEVVGEQIVLEIMVRWRASEQMKREVAWLVRNHLEVSHVLRFRDLADTATAADFGELVQTRERLAMLTLLAYSDVNAVAEQLWTPSMDASLEELYQRTLAHLNLETHAPVSHTKQKLRRELLEESVSDSAVEDFVAGLPVHYLNSTPIETIRQHVRMVARARQGEVFVEAALQRDLSATEITVCCPDSPGLLSKILGVFYALDLRVQQFRISTTRGEPIALDTFLVDFSGRPLPAATIDEVLYQLRAILTNEAEVDDLLRRKNKDPDREQRVLSYRYLPGTPGILEIQAPRGRGLPFRISRWVARQGWNITSARLGQWAEKASAALYLVGPNGTELSTEVVNQAVQARSAK